MAASESRLSLLVFGRNCGIDFQATIDTIETVVSKYPTVEFQLVIVDDGSDDKFRRSVTVKEDIFSSVERIDLPQSLGISGAINTGTQYVKFEKMIWLPASNMYGETAICNLIDYSRSADLVIGFRTNLTTARPLVKIVSSLLVRGVMHLLTFHYISDFKGLNLYNTKDVRAWLNPNKAHGGDLVLLTQILLRTNKVVQVPTPINELHNYRESKIISDNWPSRKAIYSVIRGILTSAKIYRSKKN